MRVSRRVRIGGAALLIAAIAFVAAVLWRDHGQATADLALPGIAENYTPAQIARGHYLAIAGDCVACHSAPDGAPFAGGLRMATPFGTIVSSNITSDRETGIGGWTRAQFVAALRNGIGRHGHLYPAMPYTSYTKLSDRDVADLWAWVRTIPAVSHGVTEDQLPFPLSIRPLMIGWNLINFRPGRFVQPTRDALLNRGAYLTDALEHCGACHTPKTFLYGDKDGRYLQGAGLQGWHAPDLSPNQRTGLGRWSRADIVRYLAAGTSPHVVAAGPMAEAVENSTQHLSPEDLDAIAAWLEAQPARASETPKPIATTDPAMIAGGKVYAVACAACHRSDGTGLPDMVPSLAGSAAVQADDPASLIRVVLAGARGPQTRANPTAAGMPAFAWKLSDREIAAVLTRVRNGWDNRAAAVSVSDVAAARKRLKVDGEPASARK